MGMKTQLIGFPLVPKIVHPNAVSGLFALHAICTSSLELSQDIDRIFHDFPPVSDEEMGESRENREAIRQIEESIRFDKEIGKYAVALPWRHGCEAAMKTFNSVDSHTMAIRRLRGILHLQQDAPRKAHIFSDKLLGGPNLMNSLPKVVMNFCSNKIAFMTDIAAFLHNVFVDEKDADVFHYFFFADENMDRIVEKRFKGHIFGSAAFSIVTSFVMRHHAEKMRPYISESVYNTMRHFIYVDDLSGGDRTVEGALQQKKELVEAMCKGGFSLSKWKLNAPELFDESANFASEPHQRAHQSPWHRLGSKGRCLSIGSQCRHRK